MVATNAQAGRLLLSQVNSFYSSRFVPSPDSCFDACADDCFDHHVSTGRFTTDQASRALRWKAMFDSLSDRFDAIFSRIKGRGRLGEAEVEEVLREIRVALLEADVNFVVVRSLVDRIRVACVGAELSQVLNPAQQVIKIVHQELIQTLGGETLNITFNSKPPTVVLMAGLQGAGKTTNTAKLARWFKAQGRNVLLVGADLQRPAAVEQLRVLGGQVGVPVYSEASDPVTVARNGLEEARRLGKDVLIVDTAGRLSIDAELMDEVRRISEAVSPDYTFLVIDAMTGQDSVTTAEAFHAILNIDGVIMTKLDGDARGGAALSVKEVIGRPIAFASTGEKLADFDQFHPDRMASRILGMGDVLTLIEQAEQAFDAGQAEAAAEALMSGTFTLTDFMDQMRQVRKMGPLKNLLSMMPGVGKELKDVDIDDRELDRVEAIILSMTKEERVNTDLINASRRQRIASGAGRPLVEVNNLLKQFGEMQKMMKSMGPGMAKAMKGGGGKFQQARAVAKAVRSGDIDPDQLKALGLPGGGMGGMAGAPPKLPSLPMAGSGGKKAGGGRVTAPGSTPTFQNKNKKKKR
jgi:signal recognition particle subunit SRP54